MQPRFVSYLRVSSRHQVDGDGFPRQRASIEQWAQTHGAVHLAEFVEEGVSGTTELINRPALTRLTQYILESGREVTHIVIEKADRLARDLIVSELLLKQFSEMGIRVIEAEGGNDLTAGNQDNPTAKLVRQILAAVAEFEKTSVVTKLRAARNRKRAMTGRCEGQKPYGHYAKEKEVVQVMAHLRSEGLTLRQIVDELNERGYRNRAGSRWGLSSVGAVVGRIERLQGFEV